MCFIHRSYKNFKTLKSTAKNSRMSNNNWSAKIKYLTKTVLLEKQPFHNNSANALFLASHSITDLKDSYNRQLVHKKLIAEESSGVDRKIIKLLTATLSILEYYLQTSYNLA